MRGLVSIVFALMLLVGASLGSAQKDQGKSTPSVNQAAGVRTQIAVEIFIGKDRDVIRQYYVGHRGSLPPGLAKRGGKLPPGLEKQLQRNGHLPPGLDKRIAAFPVELERQLAPLKPGLVRGIIQGQAVIYDPKTSVILDVLLIL